MELRISDKKKAIVNPGMNGLFFEDINYAADGGLYAEMIENRSFEFVEAFGEKGDYYTQFDGGYGWSLYPADADASIAVVSGSPLCEENPHYLRLTAKTGGAAVPADCAGGYGMRTQEKLIYTNERGESIEFSPASSYHVNFKDVTGLSDVRNAIYSTNSMGQDGDTYLGYRIESRDIDIVGYIKERDKQAAQNLRRKLNRILNPQYEATLTYVFGDFRRVIGCKIDDAPIFKRKPIFEQFTVSLSCLNPFWREETETREDIATWIGGFEFPVPDGLELYDGWEIGYRQPSLIVNVYNSGDVKSGIRIEFRAIGAVTNPVLLNVDTREFIKLNISLVAGDVLTVSTGYGEKAVKLNRGGTITDAFRYLDVDSSYLQIAVGDNLFRYSADANAENLEVSIYHNNLYLGV